MISITDFLASTNVEVFEALKGGWLYYNDNDLFAQTQWMIILAKVHITYKIIVIDYANSTEPLNTMQKHSLSKHLDWLG